ncbi:CBS domain-containing protein [Streptomyces klenkii]|uniref:CBS domain-containing protein n=1 Tax=Streptomyces klenkii TaxID=1420899 RepID=A0A3B0BR45_9ACTN|nr:CBS domain-containing protein [Streptomyces klenkii]RKN74778.1 CBS domain-containing protein [Streptomyces klenkii]
MTLIQTQDRSAHGNAVRRMVAEGMEPDVPRVCDDMTVEVALSVMAAARTGHLLVCDEDDLCTGVVTRARLAAVHEGDTYTDRLRLRDVLGEREPFASPLTTTVEAEHVMRPRRPESALPVAGEQGCPSVIPALAR